MSTACGGSYADLVPATRDVSASTGVGDRRRTDLLLAANRDHLGWAR